jgi:hypothetical protein
VGKGCIKLEDVLVAFMAGSFWYKKPMPKSNVFKDIGVVLKVGVEE